MTFGQLQTIQNNFIDSVKILKQKFTFRVRIFTDIPKKPDKDSGYNLINSGYLCMVEIIRIHVNS